MWIQNLKYAIHNFRKNKMYSLLNTVGLSIGLSIVTIIVLFLMSEYNKDKNISNYDNIYRLYSPEQNTVALDYTLSGKLLGQFPEIENACAVRTFYGFDFSLTSENNFTNENKAFFTDNTFFDLFDIRIIKSISEKPLPDYQSAVITESLANKLFPNMDPLGQTINFFGFLDFYVSAVVQDFKDKSLNCNFIVDGNNPQFNNWGQNNKVTFSSHYLVLTPNTNINTFSSKLNTFLSQQEPEIGKVGLQKLEDIYLDSGDVEYNAHEYGNKKMLAIFLAISILILLLSNINNFNYNLSLQYNSLKDIGVRKTNGAGDAQILKLLITDSFLKVLLSASISVGLTILALPLVSSLLGGQLDPTFLLAPLFLIFAFLFIILVILLNSIAPIYIFSRFDIRTFLAQGRSKNNLHAGKSILTVFQLAISVLLLISVMAIKKQIAYVKHADIGFNKEELVRINLPMLTTESKARAFKDEITRLPFVYSASLSNGIPGMINYSSSSNIDGNDFPISELLVDANFLQTMGIKLLDGRDFRKGENNQVCIINETALKNYGWEDFEKETYSNRSGLDVIGICSDFNTSSLHQLPVPVCLIYGDNRDDYMQISIRLQGGETTQILDRIESQWNTMFSPVPFDFTFYDQFFDSMYRKEERIGKILSVFSLLAFLITCLGILCISFQNSLNRTKEIGIRKVNGAKISEILTMLNRDYVK